MKSGQFVTLTGQAGKQLQTQAAKAVSKAFSKNASLAVVHVLFHWNNHSFFTYHQDTDGEVTVIVNLMYGAAEMHVAGKAVAKYEGIGSAHLFPGKLFHRSGAATRRCVKVAFFFQLSDQGDAMDLEAESASAAGPSSQESKVIKDEVKEEEEPPCAQGADEDGAEASQVDEQVVKAEKAVKDEKGDEAASPSEPAPTPKKPSKKRKTT